MKERAADLSGRAAELARAFDAAFAEAAQQAAREPVDVLAIQLGTEPHALRLSQLAGVFARRTIVPLPSALPELLGLVSIRSAIVPVYDLGALLGRPRQAEPRWLALATQAPIALSYSELDGYWRLPTEAIVAATDETPGGDGPGGGQVLELVRAAAELRPMVHLPSVIEVIVRRTQQAKGAREDV